VPLKQLQDDAGYWFRHAYRNYKPTSIIRFGKHYDCRGCDIVVFDKEGDRITYERHFYFMSPQRKIYSFELNCNRDEFTRLNVDLDAMLANLTFHAVARPVK